MLPTKEEREAKRLAGEESRRKYEAEKIERERQEQIKIAEEKNAIAQKIIEQVTYDVNLACSNNRNECTTEVDVPYPYTDSAREITEMAVARLQDNAPDYKFEIGKYSFQKWSGGYDSDGYPCEYTHYWVDLLGIKTTWE